MNSALLTVPLALTADDAQAAYDAWGFNCGPGALCAVSGLAPADVRPHLGDFEAKRYTNPTLMAQALRSLRIGFRTVYQYRQGDEAAAVWPEFGLVRVQWDGPWCKPGVPVAASYRHTHWIAVDHVCPASEDAGKRANDPDYRLVFDVNALGVGGWLTYREWASELVPWLLKQVEPKANGVFWPTHCWEITK